ncbi:MAG: hypothetical protein Q4C47_00005, partial [Planctomycetia bacterium]|nr:hypothetical protein [Planctomycetia bacterium]
MGYRSVKMGVLLGGWLAVFWSVGMAQEPLWTAAIDPDRPIRVDAEVGKSLVIRSVPCEVLQPASLYRFEFHARRPEGSGSVVAGPGCVSRDYSQIGSDWGWYSHIFRTPDNLPASVGMRIGLWEGSGYVECDAMRVTQIVPIHLACPEESVPSLGSHESFDADGYHLRASFDGEGVNDHRTLAYATAGFNTNRWCLGAGSVVVYAIPNVGGSAERPVPVRIEVNVNYHVGGKCIVETASGSVLSDLSGSSGIQWTTSGEIDGVATRSFETRQEWVDGEDRPEFLFVRIRGDQDANFQVDRIRVDRLYSPEFLADGRKSFVGETLYAQIEPADTWKPAQEPVEEGTLGGLTPGEQFLELRRSPGDRATSERWLWSRNGAGGIDLTLFWRGPETDGVTETSGSQKSESQKGGTSDVVERVTVGAPAADGELHQVCAEFFDGLVKLKTSLRIPDYYRTDYGTGLTSDDVASVWWCDATRKIPKSRAAPDVRGRVREAVRMAACRGDREAAQLVVQPKPRETPEDGGTERKFRGMVAKIGDLYGFEHPGAKIPAEAVSLNWVRYHWVEHPTDSTCVRDWWPDALIPMRPMDGEWNENQPLWIEIAVPYGIPADTYTGMVTLTAKSGESDWRTEIPVQIQVWNFDLPRTPRLESGYGISPGWIARYHNLTTDADRRAVFDMYLEALSDSRICVYDPVPYDPFTVKFIVDGENSRAEFDFSRWDAAMERVIEKYRITNFRLPMYGMGGGTFHSRTEPSLEGFGEQTPEYQAMFRSYVMQLENHLVGKGWIDMAYVYWFDEPEPKDYEYVRTGMERIHRYAPRIRTMLTEEPGSPEFADCIDLWCPISNLFDQEKADVQMAKGQKFWWYVCCGPKAPYCTEFTDHPATELRIWFWQAWQRRITGSLIWHTTWWTSDTAFPDSFQDPYADPMCYTSGYGLTPGTKAFWGNGDGRFLYPPEECHVPGSAKDADGNPV